MILIADGVDIVDSAGVEFKMEEAGILGVVVALKKYLPP
jgi:hypothetical protein